MKYYKYPKWPLEPVINRIPGDYMTDVMGNLYVVGINGDARYLCDSVLGAGIPLEELGKLQYAKLFVVMMNKQIEEVIT